MMPWRGVRAFLVEIAQRPIPSRDDVALMNFEGGEPVSGVRSNPLPRRTRSVDFAVAREGQQERCRSCFRPLTEQNQDVDDDEMCTWCVDNFWAAEDATWH